MFTNGKKLPGVFIVLILLVGVLSGCISNGEDIKDNGVSLDAEQYFNAIEVADPTSFDSAMATDAIAINMLMNLMEPLMRFEEQEDGSFVSAYAGAESYSVSEDGLVWTFTIRDNKWSDGQSVTAYDYAYGITRVLDPEVGSPYSYIMLPILNATKVNYEGAPVDSLGVKALDDKTLEITLEYPTSYFEKLIYHSTMLPAREDLVATYGDQYGTAVDKCAYNGPFMADSWIHNSELVFEPNPGYWDRDSVKLEKLTYKIIQEENAIYSSLENQSIDSAIVGSAEWVNYFVKSHQLEHQEVAAANTFYAYYNQYDELFSNAKVRKAFTIAIDREKLIEVIYDGLRTPAYSIVPHGLYVGENIQYVEKAQMPIKKLIEDNPDPKALLVEGLDELGLDTDPSNHTVTISFGGTDQFTKTLGEYIQQIYKQELGINIRLKMQDWGAFADDWYTYEYQMGMMSFGADFNDPLSMLSPVEGVMDGYVIGWANDVVDDLLYDAFQEQDDDKRLELMEQLDMIFEYQDGCVSPLVWNNVNYFTYDYVKGITYSQFSTSGYKYVYTQGRP